MLPSTSAAPRYRATLSEDIPDETCALILRIAQTLSQRTRVTELTGEDAQCIADFISELLHHDDDDAFSSDNGQLLFQLLCKLVKSAQVLPQCYNLREIKCNFSQVQEGGGYADIYQGQHEEQRVCVKAIRVFQKSDNTEMLKAFVKEIVLWAHLSHENILPFYGVHLTNSGRICMISPWIDRGDLSVYLQNFPRNPRLPLILDVIAGLRYLHRSNVVHGDLKAKNILISDHGRALITDFGISHVVVTTKLVSTEPSSGTMRWTAPELLATQDESCPSPTPWSDVWSFGCVLYEVFTRRVPFYQYTNNIHLLSLRLKGKVITPRKPKVGDELDHVDEGTGKDMWKLMNKCWHRKPRFRPSSEDIHEFVTSLVGVQKKQNHQDACLWKTAGGGSGSLVDYEHVYSILYKIHLADHVPSPLTRERWSTHSDANSLYTSQPRPRKRLSHAPSTSDSQRGSIQTTTGSFFTALSLAPFSEMSSRTSMSMFGEPEDEIIIAVIGTIGSGKSSFIKIATGSEDVQIGHTHPCTQQIQAIRCPDPRQRRNIVFVDTPGFDGSTTETEILAEIAGWLGKTYDATVKLFGILYLHRITDNQMTNTLVRNLNIFFNVCGNDAFFSVRLVTTHWDQLDDNKIGAENEEWIREKYWDSFLREGSQMHRFEHSCSSAWKIIDSLLMEGNPIPNQEKAVDQRKSLWKTKTAGSPLSWVRRAVRTLKDSTLPPEKSSKAASCADSLEKQEVRKGS